MDSESNSVSGIHNCYILRTKYEPHRNRTYVGYTPKPKRRIRQHNQEIVGGARYTKRFGNKSWEFLAIVHGLPNKINALQCEWRLKHPDNRRRTNRKYFSPKGRILGLSEVLKLEKWTNNSTILNSEMNLKVYVIPDFYPILAGDLEIPNNIELLSEPFGL